MQGFRNARLAERQGFWIFRLRAKIPIRKITKYGCLQFGYMPQKTSVQEAKRLDKGPQVYIYIYVYTLHTYIVLFIYSLICFSIYI